MTAILKTTGLWPTSAAKNGLEEIERQAATNEHLALGMAIIFERWFVALTQNQPELWIKLGLELRLHTYGHFGLACLTAPTLRDNLMFLPEAHTLLYTLTRFHTVKSSKDLFGLELDLREVPEDLQTFTILRDLGALIAAHRDISPKPLPATRVELKCTFEGLNEIFANLGAPTIVKAPRNRIFWSSDVLDQPLPNGNLVLHNHYLALTRALLGQSQRKHANENMPDELKRLLRRRLESSAKDLTLYSIASELGLSGRTLQRRLKDRGIEFRCFADAARQEIAEELLSDPFHSISDVASFLGYADLSSFNHAFQRWTGKSPRGFRDRKQDAFSAPQEKNTDLMGKYPSGSVANSGVRCS
jgi:AraC-like DNA-binding protein